MQKKQSISPLLAKAMDWLWVWVLFTFVAVIGGEVYDLYETISWFDLALHFLAGVILTRMMYEMYSPKTLLHIFFITSVVVNLLVSWELLEYAADTFLDLNMQKDGLKDTMEDIIIGKLGCLSVYLWKSWNNR